LGRGDRVTCSPYSTNFISKYLLAIILKINSMTHYLIEYRFTGRAKTEIRQMIYELDNRFHLEFFRSKRPIPHITFAGPLTTNNEAKLVRDFTTLCKATPFCSFKIKGFGSFKNSRVVFVNIDPSEKLKEFRWNLAQYLMPYCTLRDFDYTKDFEFHATLAMDLNHEQFNSVKSYISRQDLPTYKHFLIRATVIKNQKILYEYDFLQRKLLNRHDALDKRQSATTMKLLNDYFDGRYDPNSKLNERQPKMTNIKLIKSQSGIVNRSPGIIGRIRIYFQKLFK
jgi:2'-5' RNA ligase